jgi:hypothetical protein
VTCKSVDLGAEGPGGRLGHGCSAWRARAGVLSALPADAGLDALLAELTLPTDNGVVALRGDERWCSATSGRR